MTRPHGTRRAVCAMRIRSWVQACYRVSPHCADCQLHSHTGLEGRAGWPIRKMLNPPGSASCSCRSRTPLIGLIRLRRALGGETPLFDPIHWERSIRCQSERGWATRKRHTAGNGRVTCHRVKVGTQSDTGGVSRERNPFRTGWLLRPWRHGRVSMRKQAIPAPRETGGR